MDSIEMEEVHKKYEEEIASHSQIINSLRARIEELEADSIAKDQDIKELRQEFNNLILTTSAQGKKTTVSGTTFSSERPPTINSSQRVFIHEYVDDTQLKCKICENIFTSNKEFNKHAKVEHEIKYLCFNCSEVFKDKSLRGRHISKYHTKYCSYCNKIFNVEASLEKRV
jgi:uncharacterized C2H2 Zn-finger protein